MGENHTAQLTVAVVSDASPTHRKGSSGCATAGFAMLPPGGSTLPEEPEPDSAQLLPTLPHAVPCSRSAALTITVTPSTSLLRLPLLK